VAVVVNTVWGVFALCVLAAGLLGSVAYATRNLPAYRETKARRRPTVITLPPLQRVKRYYCSICAFADTETTVELFSSLGELSAHLAEHHHVPVR
jgi:hypothetical protein